MSLILIGPWLHALWIRASEAGHCETVNAHPDRAERVVERVAHPLSGSQGPRTNGRRYNRCKHPSILQGLALLTSCSPDDVLSDAQTWSGMAWAVATTPAPADGRGPAGGEIVL